MENNKKEEKKNRKSTYDSSSLERSVGQTDQKIHDVRIRREETDPNSVLFFIFSIKIFF